MFQENQKIIEDEEYTTSDGTKYQLHDLLKKSFEGTEFFPADFSYTIPNPPTNAALVEVTKETTIGCLLRLVQEGFKPCALNFANGFRAGGGYIIGNHAQEGSICRCSALYNSLTQPQCQIFYDIHNQKKDITTEGSDNLIFSPDVPIFRDQSEQFIPPITASFITSPAPDLRFMSAEQSYLDALMLSRIRKIIQLAVHKQQKVLVLGAFGCGNFLHDPKNVVKCFEQVMKDEGYEHFFDKIVYAIYGGAPQNYLYFARAFGTPNQLTQKELDSLE